MATSFNDLLQRAEELSTGLKSTSELPNVQKSFQQLLDAGQRLCQKTPNQQDDMQVKASLLLSTKGQDIPKISKRIKTLVESDEVEHISPYHQTDIEGYLQSQQESAILAVVEQQKLDSAKECEERRWKGILSSWENEKQAILKKIVGSDGALNFLQEVSVHKTLETSTDYCSNTSMRPLALNPWQLTYADQVKTFNDGVINGSVHPDLAKLCLSAVEKMKDVSITAIWKMVMCFTEPSGLPKASDPISQLKQQVKQSLGYLEKSYKEYVQSAVYSSPHIAQLGGIPSPLILVKSFLKILNVNLVQDDDIVDGFPFWCIVLYCLRCGDLKTAAEFAQTQQHQFPEFNAWIQEYCTMDRKLSPASKQKLKIYYKHTIRNSMNLYKKAVYCILGKFEFVDSQQEIIKKSEDYLWFKLSQVEMNSNPISTSHDDLSLLKLQEMISINYGESHFNALNNPTLYFQMLFLTCQFEASIEFLSRFDNLLCHAVHIALVLHVHGLLNVTNKVNSKLLTKLYDTDGVSFVYQLNLVHLLMFYTKKFELSQPNEAINYFYFLRDLTKDGKSLFAHCLSELVHETGEFGKLLGSLKSDGSRQPGIIDKFFPDTSSIVAKVAQISIEKGQNEDAVHLYDLSGDSDKVLTLLNRLLGKVVSQADNVNADRIRLKQMSLGIAESYRVQNKESDATLRSTFHLLLDLLSFFDLYHADRVEQAIDLMNQLHLLPISSGQVQEKAKAFTTYSDEITQNISDILLAMMNLLTKRCKRAPESMKPTLRECAKSLIVFAGLLPYQLPGNTTSYLVKLEVQMN